MVARAGAKSTTSSGRTRRSAWRFPPAATGPVRARCPNGCLPSLEVIGCELARRTDMRTLGLHELTPHYPETLRRWRANFEAARARLQALGYDERFRRMWRMYLSYCEAGFTERRVRLVQMLLAKPRFHAQPGKPDNFDSLTPDSVRSFLDQILGVIAAVVVPVTMAYASPSALRSTCRQPCRPECPPDGTPAGERSAAAPW